MPLHSINPANARMVREYEPMSTRDVGATLVATTAAAPGWRAHDFSDRSELFKGLAERLRQRARDYAELMALEMGKPVREGRDEVEKCAWVCDYYADNAADFLADIPLDSDAPVSAVVHRPLGTVLAVMPWNFPFWQVFRFAAPTLMAGNTALLKHASNVTGCALEIESLFREAHFPPDVFRALLVPGDQMGPLIADARIDAVSLTGSSGAGRKLAATAGQALKKTVLELGGSDPYVVLADADVTLAADKCATSRLINNGQSCIAAKRFIVERPVARDFAEAVVERMSERTVGDPMDEDTDLGPMAREDLRDTLVRQADESVAAGARRLLGGEDPQGAGYYVSPGVLLDPPRGAPAMTEETFGPLATIITVESAEAAIDVANDTDFGLGAAVFTGDEQRGLQLARDRLDAGCCAVNDFVRSDPRMPFGGIKDSGYGRELGAPGIREFVNLKTVYTGGE